MLLKGAEKSKKERRNGKGEDRRYGKKREGERRNIEARKRGVGGRKERNIGSVWTIEWAGVWEDIKRRRIGDSDKS